MEEWEGEVVDDPVAVVVLVRHDLGTHAEAREAQVEVGAVGALDAHGVGDVARAVVAVVERPAGTRKSGECLLRYCGAVHCACQRRTRQDHPLLCVLYFPPLVLLLLLAEARVLHRALALAPACRTK